MMDTNLFRQILNYDAFYYSCLAIVFIIIILWAFFARRKESKENFTIMELLMALAVTVIFWSAKVIPIIKDLNTNSYVEMCCTYRREKNQSNNLPMCVYAVSDGTEMQLYLPHKDRYTSVGDAEHHITADEVAFPVGEYEGTAWYSENSHYILKFIPDES